MRKLYHPNVIQLMETFEDESNIYVVLELCSGGELFDRLACQRGIPEHSAASIMQQLASAVKYIHAERICHRDVKPESFLLKECGSDVKEVCVKMIGFGTAKEFGPTIDMKTKICTLHYVAPEVLTRKSVPYTEKIDVWSLGVLFFMILSGCPPFHAQNELDTLKSIKQGNYQFNPPEIWANISEDAKVLISSMLVVDPAKRVSAAEVLANDWFLSMAKRGFASKACESLVTEDQLNNLRNFHARNRVQKAVLRLKGHKLSDDAVSELRSMFQRLDEDGTGEVHISHVLDRIRRISAVKENMEEIMRVLWSLEGGTGKVKFDIFLDAMVERHRAVEKDAVRAVFDALDLDGSGKISHQELKMALGVDNDSCSFLSGVEAVLGVKADDIASKLMNKFSPSSVDREYDFDEFFEILNAV
jgi:calcium-dependent protein kinase